jgi:hypothetical protein
MRTVGAWCGSALLAVTVVDAVVVAETAPESDRAAVVVLPAVVVAVTSAASDLAAVTVDETVVVAETFAVATASGPANPRTAKPGFPAAPSDTEYVGDAPVLLISAVATASVENGMAETTPCAVNPEPRLNVDPLDLSNSAATSSSGAEFAVTDGTVKVVLLLGKFVLVNPSDT